MKLPKGQKETKKKNKDNANNGGHGGEIPCGSLFFIFLGSFIYILRYMTHFVYILRIIQPYG